MKTATEVMILLVVLCVAAIHTQARPDHPAMMMMTDQAEQQISEPTIFNTTDSASIEDEDPDSELSTEEEIRVQAKASSMCPSRQPEIVEIEMDCAMEDEAKKEKCKGQNAGQMENKDAEMIDNMNYTTDAMVMDEADNSTMMDDPQSINTTTKHGSKHNKHTCNYHQCILRKLEVLDSMDMPNQTLLHTWIMTNISDDHQKEMTKNRLEECVVTLKDIFQKDMDTSKSSEMDNSTESPIDHKKESCGASKKVIICLFKSAECPVIQKVK